MLQWRSRNQNLIADETADYVDQQYKKNHFSKDYFKDATVDLSEIENAVQAKLRKRNETSLGWQILRLDI